MRRRRDKEQERLEDFIGCMCLVAILYGSLILSHGFSEDLAETQAMQAQLVKPQKD